MKLTTESDSHYDGLELMNLSEILFHINNEDKKVAISVEKQISKIENLTNKVICKLKKGGRLFYLGAGTSGRLGILDASECPPTFGVNHNMVVGLIAGGDIAIRRAIEFAEDDINLGWKDLQNYNITSNDIVIGIAASGSTPYVIGALKKCQEENIITGCVVCNTNTSVARFSDYPIEVIVGPEFLTGSTRMKAGTAQKLVLNMISTSVMIKLGRVKGNKMVDMQLSNNKLFERGIKIIMKEINVNYDTALNLLKKYGSVREVISKKNEKR